MSVPRTFKNVLMGEYIVQENEEICLRAQVLFGDMMYPGVSSKVPAYDKVPTMFSPDGRLYQVEYASKIVEQGSTGVGLVYKEGVVLAADKSITSKLLVPESIEKIFKIDTNIAVVSAGLVGDARRLVGIARRQAQDNRMVYSEKIQVEVMAREIAETKQAFTQYGGLRPFGVAFIIGGFDEKGPSIFETEPSGALAEYKAVAVGRNKEKAMASGISPDLNRSRMVCSAF